MFIDKALQVSNEQAVTVSAASTDSIDFGQANPNVGLDDRSNMVITVDESAAAAGAATVTFSVQDSADNATFADVAVTAAIGKASLAAGQQVVIPMPTKLRRYCRVYYTIGSSDNASIWLIVWGPNTCHTIFPKGSAAGLQSRDLGEHTLTDAAGGRYQGYRTHYKWDIGAVLRDWRYVVRIANIDVSDLTKNASAGADLIDLMTRALELVPNVGMGRPAFYMPRKIRSFLRRQITNKVAASTLTMEEIAGKKVVAFDGVPCRRTDALLLTEARVV